MRSFKFYTICLILLALIFTTPVYAKNYLFFAPDGTIGGTAGKLDNIDQCNADNAGYDLVDKDAAIVVDQAGGRALFYNYDGDSVEAESDPGVVAPDYCDEPGAFGAGRWILVDIQNPDGLLGSTYQPLESTLTDIADGTIAENLVNTAYPWADNEVADNLSLSLLKLTPLTSEPTEVVGEIYRASNPWNPCGIAGSPAPDYFVICTAADTYVALWDVEGNFYFSTIQAAMKVIPDADGITLTAAQMNAVIVATNASEVQIPADQCDTVTGKWITVKQTGAYAVDIAVLDAADDIYMLDGTKIEGTTHEIQTAGASGNQITLMCIAVNEWWVTGEIGTSTSEAAD